jgi:phytoene dehydrogenase-like protein
MGVSEVDVVVVGGGVAGMVSAAFAAESGASVLLVEAASEFGGRARTRIVSGYHFNQGAHALYRDGFLDKALQDLGITAAGRPPALADGVFVYENALHPAPFRAAGLAATTLLSDVEKAELASLLRSLRDGSPDVPSGISLSAALAALSPSPMVRSVLAALVRLTSIVHAPEVADGRTLLDQLHGGLTRGARYLDGGWGTMIDSLCAACAQRGVDLRSSCRVESIERDTRWRVGLADGTGLTARAVVLAVNPAQAATLCPAFDAVGAAAAAAVPAKVACLDLGLAHLPRPDVLFALAVDRPLYFSVHSNAARLAPDGAALIHTMRYVEPGETFSRDQLVAELEGFVDLAQPGWREHERARQFLPAMPVISSIPLAAKGGASGRPSFVVPDVDGLFISGDWVGPLGLLSDTAAASGRSAGEAAAAFARA